MSYPPTHPLTLQPSCQSMSANSPNLLDTDGLLLLCLVVCSDHKPHFVTHTEVIALCTSASLSVALVEENTAPFTISSEADEAILHTGAAEVNRGGGGGEGELIVSTVPLHTTTLSQSYIFSNLTSDT